MAVLAASKTIGTYCFLPPKLNATVSALDTLARYSVTHVSSVRDVDVHEEIADDPLLVALDTVGN